jgi:flagellar hook-associated protein 2
MTTSSVSGLASGINWADIISQLMEIERRPITLLETKKSDYQEKLSTWQSINTRLLSFKTKADSLKSSSNFLLKTASSSHEAMLTVSASSSAVACTHTVTVSQLAQSHKMGSQGWADTDTTAVFSGPETGTFTFKVGSGDEVEVTVDQDTTLADFRDAINAADGGATATILNDGDDTMPYRLILTANESGTDHTITITNNDTDLVIATLEGQEGKDASLTVDGISITKSSNTVTDVIEGVTLNLLDADDTETITVTVSNDTTGVISAINDFVDAYNEALALIDEQFQYNAETETSGPLSADVTLRNIQQQLRGILSTSIEGLTGDYVVLSQLGIKTGSDGQLAVNESDLSDALADDFVGVSKIFVSHGSTTHSSVSYMSHSDDTDGGTYYVRIQSGALEFSSDQVTWYGTEKSGNTYTGTEGPTEGLRIQTAATEDGSYGTVTLTLGVAAQFSRQLDFLTDAYTGSIHYQAQGIENIIEDIDDSILDLEDRMDLIEARYTRQFAALETLLGQMQTQSDWLSNQILGLYS